MEPVLLLQSIYQGAVLLAVWAHCLQVQAQLGYDSA